MRDVSDWFYLNEVRDRELVGILTWRFKGSTSLHNHRLEFTEDGIVRIILIYNPKGNLDRVLSSLSDKEFKVLQTEIEEKLLGPQVYQVVRDIIFSKIPVMGWWGSKHLTIYEAEATFPKPQFNGQGFHIETYAKPFVLEVPFKLVNHQLTNIVRAQESIKEIHLVLKLFTKLLLPYKYNLIVQHWATLVESLEEGSSRTVWVQEGYSAPEFERFAPFMRPNLGLIEIPSIPSDIYFQNKSLVENQIFSIPDSLELLLSSFDTLNSADHERLMRAAYWFNHAEAVLPLSRSAALISLVQAVESLIVHGSSEKCETCGRAYGDGVGKSFRKFLERFVSKSDDYSEALKTLYKTRSNLTHGDHVLLADEYLLPTNSPGYSQEWILVNMAQEVTQTAIMGWLVDRRLRD